jgi:hypothetical protein
VSNEPTSPSVPSRDGHKIPPIAPRTGEGSGTALEALIRKRKQVEGPEPADGAEQPSSPP